MSVSPSIALKGIDHINFASSDMERTIRFWEKLGVRYQFRLTLHNPDRYHFFFNAGGATLFSYWYWPGREMQPPQSHNQPDHSGFYHIALRVESEDELEAMHAHVVANGVKASEIAGRHMFDKSFYFEDPDGIQFEFACQVLHLEGDFDHDGNGTLTPLSTDARIGKRRIDGPVHFETKYK
jgi:catechol 2,3-dioxygenase-like lactoylglutathione lyase family enzyme